MKDLASIKSVLSTLKPELEKAYHVKSIGIFGSAIRADFTSESDIDLIVDFDQPIGISFIDLADFLEQKIQAKVDLVSRNGIKPQYYTAIEKEIVYI
jgi:predicted nucleotidyltransferase